MLADIGLAEVGRGEGKNPAAQKLIFLQQSDAMPPPRQRQRRPHPGNPPADHDDIHIVSIEAIF